MAGGVWAVLVTMVALAGSSQAYDFYVGGRDGWVQQPNQSYRQWAEKNRFQVNDKLVFKYKAGEDSVLVVDKQGFDTCNTNRPIQKFDNGHTIFQFDRSGPFFFISGVPGRCQAGQKLVVVVMSPRRRPSVPPPATLPTAELPPTPAPSTDNSGSSGDTSSRALALIVALVGGPFLLW